MTPRPQDKGSAATLSWDDRLEAAFQAYLKWRDLPVALLMDRILKAAGARDLVIENQRLREALVVARPYVYNALGEARAEEQSWRVETATESLALAWRENRRDEHPEDETIRAWATYDAGAQDVGRALYVAETMILMEIADGRDPAVAISKWLNDVRDRFAIPYAKDETNRGS